MYPFNLCRVAVTDGYSYNWAHIWGWSSRLQNVRQRRVDAFNDESSSTFLMLISTRAGGLGLNLTAANKCAIQYHGY